jgi:hypothetical protein
MSYLNTQQAAYEQGKREERADLIAWLEQGEGYEGIIDLIRQGAHEGSSDD